MKFFVAFVALVAVAVATPVLKPTTNEVADMEAIVAAINSPSTDPATAALLEQQLQDILAALNPIEPAEYEPIAVGPAIVEEPQYEPISVGPAVIDFPFPDGGVISTPPVAPSPVVIGPLAPGAPTPLVHIILNINNAASPIPPQAVITPESVITPEPVIVVDGVDPAFKPEPVIVADLDIPAEPVIVPTPVVVEPVAVEPVIIGTPIIPSPAVVLPDELN